MMARVSLFIMTKTRLISNGLDTIFLIAMVLACYGLATVLNGNAYLSLYLFGIMIGNSRIRNKQMLIPFFDGVTSLSQILIFFLIINRLVISGAGKITVGNKDYSIDKNYVNPGKW